MKRSTKAVAYLRVSGQGQVEGDGFPRQRAAIERYAKAHGLELVDEYRDEGVSGTTELADRPGLAALLDRVESNGVKVVLVERADRLARDLMVSEVILGQFRKVGVRVIAADGTELTVGDQDPTRTLIRQVLGAVSQFEKSVIVLKLRAARERIRARGQRCEGQRPYDPAIVERIKQLRAERFSCGEIAAKLQEGGVPTLRRTKKGEPRPWSRGTVWAILQRA